MDFHTLLYDVGEDGIATVTIDRPENLNALNDRVIDELERVFARTADDEQVRGVIVTGGGDKSFVAGADIAQFEELDATSGRRFARRGQLVFGRIAAMNKPVIAAVNGFALGGGCELALACHLRVASRTAHFGQPEVNLGIIPGYGGSQRLPRLVGGGLATELILTGERITAERAYEIGMVNRVAPAEALMDVTRELLATILSRGPVAVGLALDALRASNLPLEDGLRYEAALFGQACATEDAREGASAFLERREPNFKGR